MLRIANEVKNQAQAQLPEITVGLVRVDNTVSELRITAINGRKSETPLLEIVQSQVTGKLYVNLLQQEQPGDENPFILLRENTGCIEHFNYVQRADGTRKSISSHYPKK